MKRSLPIEPFLLAASIVILGVAVRAQTPTVPQSTPTPARPVSISPAMPLPGSAPADATELTEPSGSNKSAGAKQDPSYVLGAGDQISVSFWREPDLDGSFTIGPDGTISIRLIGSIKAAGLTCQQLQESLDRAAFKELKTPRSSVNLLASHSKHIYFDGAGITPGVMDLVMPIHLLEALSAHGCCLDFANKNKIQIRRDGKLLHDEGGKKTEFFRYEDMLHGKQSNPLLLDGDHIIVP